MREIDVSTAGKLRRITALSYGASRSGKTRFAGSWPRPLFLADATESGWTTLSNMDKNVLFEPGRIPRVWAIEKVPDMFAAIKDAEPLLARGEIQTIVVDSLTFYSDLFFNFAESVAGPRTDPRQLYQKLAAHLKTLREQIHLLGCNVVWLCLAKDPGEDQPMGGPMLSGQNAAKFAAGCDYVFYHRSFQAGVNSPLQWEIRTRRYMNYAAGGRDEGLLPDPIGYVIDGDDGNEQFVPDCTYRTLAESLGILEADGSAPSFATSEPEPIEAPTSEAPASSNTATTASPTNGANKKSRPTPPASRAAAASK